MAANTYVISRFNGLIANGQEPVVVGNQRRRAISFHLCSGAGSLTFDPAAFSNDLQAMFQVSGQPFYVLLRYEDWGELVCGSWFWNTSGVPENLLIYEAILL